MQSHWKSSSKRYNAVLNKSPAKLVGPVSKLPLQFFPWLFFRYYSFFHASFVGLLQPKCRPSLLRVAFSLLLLLLRAYASGGLILLVLGLSLVFFSSHGCLTGCLLLAMYLRESGFLENECIVKILASKIAGFFFTHMLKKF